MGLYFVVGFFCSVERSIKNPQIVLADVAFAIRPVWRKHRADLVEIPAIYWFAIKMEFSKLNAHGR